MSKPSFTSHSRSQTTRIRRRRSRFDVICTALATTLTHNCTIIQGAIDGTMNILRQGAAKGIKKFVLTSSWVTVLDRESCRFAFPEWRTVVNGRVQPHWSNFTKVSLLPRRVSAISSKVFKVPMKCLSHRLGKPVLRRPPDPWPNVHRNIHRSKDLGGESSLAVRRRPARTRHRDQSVPRLYKC